MKRRLNSILVLGVILTVILSACTTNIDTDIQEELEAKNSIIEALEEEIQTLEDRINELEEIEPTETQSSLLSRAIEVVEVIKDEDMTLLASYIHPNKGVRFSPYGYVNSSTDQVFNTQQIANLMQDTQIYSWGSYDGTGDPIDLNFSDYYDRFIYDQDFANPHMIGNNIYIGLGNTLNNIEDVYPNGEFIEFHFTGFDSQYEGMDWRSLKLVFEEDNGIWYLLGIVHDEWTI